MSDYQGLVCTHWGHWSELSYQTLTRQALAPGQVRIRVRHAGVGFAVSLFVAGKYQRKPPLPFTPGTEAKRAALLTNGAHHALPADAQALPLAVKALCPRGGVDVVFDPAWCEALSA